MKILVTGHKGFIGSNMIKALSAENHTVTGYEWGEQFPDFDFDVVIHMGAISSTNEKDVDKVMRQNYEFTMKLASLCEENNCMLQYSSSASVYGNGPIFSEDASVDPKSAYAWSKYLCERYIMNSKFKNITQGFRYFNVYGPGEGHKSQPSPYEAFSRQSTIKLFNGSDRIKRDFVPVETVVRTHIEFLKVPESGIWNIGSGQPISFLDVANTFNKPIEYIEIPEDIRSNYQWYTCADLAKIRRTISDHGLNLHHIYGKQ